MVPGKDMVTRGKIDSSALSYLVTAVIDRLHETDTAWCRDFLQDVTAARNTVGGDVRGLVPDRAIGIDEHALKPEPMATRHGH